VGAKGGTWKKAEKLERSEPRQGSPEVGDQIKKKSGHKGSRLVCTYGHEFRPFHRPASFLVGKVANPKNFPGRAGDSLSGNVPSRGRWGYIKELPAPFTRRRRGLKLEEKEHI